MKWVTTGFHTHSIQVRLRARGSPWRWWSCAGWCPHWTLSNIQEWPSLGRVDELLAGWSSCPRHLSAERASMKILCSNRCPALPHRASLQSQCRCARFLQQSLVQIWWKWCFVGGIARICHWHSLVWYCSRSHTRGASIRGLGQWWFAFQSS